MDYRRALRRARRVAALGLVLLLVSAPIVGAVEYDVELRPGGSFSDDDGTFAEGAIEAIYTAALTSGCTPGNDQFCPNRLVTRGELATFAYAATDWPASDIDAFSDDDGIGHEPAINALAAAGVLDECQPGMFCPADPATRAETAGILARAFGLVDGSDIDYFFDDNENPYQREINQLATAGITSGCQTTLYCPLLAVTRAQVAIMLATALELPFRYPAPRPHPQVGSGKRIIYSNSEQQVWLIDENEQMVDTYSVSGRLGIPGAGTYQVFSKSVDAWSYDGITMKHMVRFAQGPTLAYGFHSIPLDRYGQPMQTEDELGQYRSGGCVRQANHKAEFLFNWTPVGTTVIVLP